MKFDAPPPKAVLAILIAKAQSNPELLAQIEAAQWQAIAMALQVEEEPDDDSV